MKKVDSAKTSSPIMLLSVDLRPEQNKSQADLTDFESDSGQLSKTESNLSAISQH